MQGLGLGLLFVALGVEKCSQIRANCQPQPAGLKVFSASSSKSTFPGQLGLIIGFSRLA